MERVAEATGRAEGDGQSGDTGPVQDIPKADVGHGQVAVAFWRSPIAEL